MALSLVDKAKQYFTSKSQDNEGWIRQGNFTPGKQIQQMGQNLSAWGNVANQGIKNQIDIQKRDFNKYTWQPLKENPVLAPTLNRFEQATPAIGNQLKQLNPFAQKQTPQQNWQDTKKIGAAALTAYGLVKTPLSAVLGGAVINPLIKLGTNLYENKKGADLNKQLSQYGQSRTDVPLFAQQTPYQNKPITQGVGEAIFEGAGQGLANAGTTRLTNSLVGYFSSSVPFLNKLTEKAISSGSPVASDTIKEATKKFFKTAGKRLIKAAVLETAVESPIWATFTQSEQETYLEALQREAIQNLQMNVGMAGVNTVFDSRTLLPIVKKSIDTAVDNYMKSASTPQAIANQSGKIDLNAKVELPTQPIKTGEKYSFHNTNYGIQKNPDGSFSVKESRIGNSTKTLLEQKIPDDLGKEYQDLLNQKDELKGSGLSVEATNKRMDVQNKLGDLTDRIIRKLGLEDLGIVLDKDGKIIKSNIEGEANKLAEELYKNGKLTPELTKQFQENPKQFLIDNQSKSNVELQPQPIKTGENPKIFYHGTKANFNKFDDTKLGSNTEWLNSKWGHFFSEDKNIAKRFLNEDSVQLKDTRTGRIIEAELDLKKPLDFTPEGLTTNKEQAQIIYEAMTGKKVSPNNALRLVKNAYEDATGLGQVDDFYDELYGNLKIKELAQKNGYDGLISHYGELDGKNIKEYAVFSSNQIKNLSPLSPESKGIKQPTIKIKAGNDQNLLSNQQNPLGTGKPSVSSSQESGLQAPQSTLPKIKIKVGQPNQISSGKPPSEPIIPQIKLSDIEKKIYGSETKLGNTGNKISVGPIGDKIRIVENKANEIIAKGLTAKNPVIRTSATLFQDLFGGAGKSQGQLSQKAQFRGGTDYATKIAGDTQNYIYNLLNNDTKSLERVHAVLDPEISKIKVDEASLTANEKEALKMVREVSDFINDTNHRLGFISDELWQKNRGGKYLARAYETFDYPPEVADFIKNKSIKFDLNPFKKRTEMTDWKKENAITDPAYLISKRLQQTLFNVEVKKYVDWATKSNLISDVQRPGFVQLSDSKAYGSAAGKWIRKDALEDIKGFFLTNDIGQKAYDILNWYDRNPLRRGQKMLKTVFNPAVRLGNRTGNYVFAWLNGINPVTFAKNRSWAKNAINSNDPIYRYAIQNGITGSDITKADITRISAELKRGVNDINTLQKINAWAKESYGRVDDVAKVAAFKTWLDRGVSPQEALNRTRRGFQDYNMVGMLYDLGAKIPILGNPFVRFASESIRITKNAAVDHPFRLVATLGAWKLFTDVMSRMSGEDEKDRKTRESRVGASHLPFTNISTNVQTPYGEINASRLLGFSSTFTPEDTGKLGSLGTDISKYAPFQNPLDARNYTNDPIIGPVISLATDKDFRGKSIADPKQNKYTGSLLTPGEQNLNRLGYAARSYLPPSFTDLYNIGAAIQGKENVYGQVKTPRQAILRTYPGIKIEQFGPEEAEATRQRNADYNAYELDYIQKQINAVKKQQVEGKITPDQATKRIENLNRQKITSQSDAERTFETSPEAPKDIMERISLATKATITNPTNALKVVQAIFTEEKMRKLSGDTLIFERETNLNKTKEKGDAVDHIIPLSLGGDNSDKNKRYISAEANQEKAKLETSLARKLANNEITGKEARKQIKNFMDKYSADFTPTTSTESTSETTTESTGKIYKITNKETGKDTEIDLTFPEYPKLTGLTEADKALKSSYYSALSKIKTNATKLYNDGQLKAEEYNDILTKVSTSKSKSGSGKTKSKGGKITIAKVATPTVKKYKLPTIKLPNTSLKSNIKIKKPSIAQLKKRRTIKIKV